MRLFRKKTTPTAGRSGVYEIGILFDIDVLGGGMYGWKAYKILFDSLDPHRLMGCSFHDGDTNVTLVGRARLYCIVIRSSDPLKINYVRDTLSARTDEGLLAANGRFIEGDITSQEPLVHAGDVDGAGDLVVRPDDMLQYWWTEGTVWKIVVK